MDKSSSDELSRYYIEYVCDLIRTMNPQALQEAQQLVILSSIDDDPKINDFLMKMTQSQLLYRSQAIKKGIPYFFKQSNRYLANFGKYFVRDLEQRQTSRQSMLNILYTFKLAKKIKIVLVINENHLQKEKEKIIDAFKFLDVTFTDLMIEREGGNKKSTQKQQMINQIYPCISLMVTQAGQQNLQIDVKKYLTQIFTDKELKKQWKIGYQAFQSILKEQKYFKQTKSYVYIKSFLDKLSNFKFQNTILKTYFSYNLDIKKTKSQQERSQAVMQAIKKFMNMVMAVIENIGQHMQKILSSQKKNREQCNRKLELSSSSIQNFNIRDLKVKESIKTESQMIFIIGNIFKEMVELFAKDKNEACNICLPWKIISIIYGWKQINFCKSLNQSKPYMLGYLNKVSFNVLSYVGQFKQLNQMVFDTSLKECYKKIRDIFQDQISRWVLKCCNQKSLRPKVIRKMIDHLFGIIQVINQVICCKTQNIAAQREILQDLNKHLGLYMIMIKDVYLEKMQKNFTVSEKILTCQQIHAELNQNQQTISLCYQQKGNQLMRKIYTILGNQFRKVGLDHHAKQLFIKANNHQELSRLCMNMLQQRNDELNVDDFLSIIQILVQLGMRDTCRKQCFKYIQSLTSEEDRAIILQFLHQLAENQLAITNHNFNALISTNPQRGMQMIENDKLEEMIEKYNQKVIQNKENWKKYQF